MNKPMTLPAVDIAHQEIITRWRELGELGRTIIPSEIPADPRPSEIEAVIDDLEALWAKVDPLILAIGKYVKANSSCGVDLDVFADQLRGALEGNATHECQRAADDLRAAILEAAE